MASRIKRGRLPSPSSSSEERNARSSPLSNAEQRGLSSSDMDIDTTSFTTVEDWHIPPPPKAQKTLMTVSEILFQSNSEAVLKEIEPDLAYIITKKEQPPLPITFTTSVSIRGNSFEADNTNEAGAKARAAQLILYYFMLNNDPALKRLNFSENEADPYGYFTGNPMYVFTLIKPGVKINIIRTVGTPPFQKFTARVVIDGKEKFKGVGPSKREAQNEAARNALSFIISVGNRHTLGSDAAVIENPISALIRLRPGIQINIVKEVGHTPNIVFTARVILNGRNYYGTGRRKQEAKQEAAREALSSLAVQDQLKDQSENIKEKIEELKRVKIDLRIRLKSLKNQSKSDQKTSKDWFINWDKSIELGEQKDGLEKPTESSKTAPKGALDQNLKESDPKNSTKDPKSVGKQTGKRKTKKAAPILETTKSEKLKTHKINEAPSGSSKEDPPFTDFGDHIARLIEGTFKSMKSADPSIPNYKTLAGVVMTSGPTSKGSRVISVATGSKSISGVNLSCEGKSVNDCHAEILARRGLISFIYDQLESYLVHPEDSIFEPAGGVRLRIKNHILFHLYVSTAPCGSASERGSSLRTKMEGIEGTVPVTEGRIQSGDGFIYGENLLTMSCSDKMTRWNIVGVQGSLLTHLINPIYFHAVVIGSGFHLKNLQSSLIERVENIRGIPAPFVFVEPVLAGTTQLISTGTKGSWIPISPVISICWVNRWIQPERIESTNGKLLEDGSSSSLCKRNFLQRFTSLVSQNPEWLIGNTSRISYGSLKMGAKRFRETNELLMASLLDGGFGQWVKKPNGYDHLKTHIEQPYANVYSYE